MPRRPLRARWGDQGFTILELIVVLAALAILATILTPIGMRMIEESRVSRARSEAESIASAVAALCKDTSLWPYTNANGPAGTAVSRLVSSSDVVTAVAADAGTGAGNWGSYGTTKHLGDFLYWNNPDNDSDAEGENSSEAKSDYATSGPDAWKGPYLDSYDVKDPWGHAYVVNVRYLPGGGYTGTQRHKVMVISAGPDGRWSTPYSDAVTETVMGDDIAHVIRVTN